MTAPYLRRLFPLAHPYVQEARSAGRRGVSEVNNKKLHGELVAAGIEISERGLYTSLCHMVKGEHAGYEQWLNRGQQDIAPAPPVDLLPVAVDDSAPFPEPVTVERDVVRFNRSAVPPEMVYNVGDMQLGELEFLLPAWQECNDQLVERARQARPQRITLLYKGDHITGASVFRGQEMTVGLPNTDPQLLYAAHVMREQAQMLSAIAPTRALVFWGNHDKGAGNTDKAQHLVLYLRLLGVDAYYCGRRGTVNLAPEEAQPYLLHVEHGFGNSAYYPASYAMIRALKDYLVQASLWDKFEGGRIHRATVAHTHWLAVGLDLAGVKLDVNGGFTASNLRRHGLGGAMRPVGAVLYIHDGATFVAETVQPSIETMRTSVDNPHLATDVMADMITRIRAVNEDLLALGLAPSGGVL